MRIIERFIPVEFKDTRPGLKLIPEYHTIHETDIKECKANAEAHARLQKAVIAVKHLGIFK
jgi:hypothetical protein